MTMLNAFGALLALAILARVLAPHARRYLVSPRPFPYTMAFMMRLGGWLLQLGRMLRFKAGSRAASGELIHSLRQTTARDIAPLRDTYLALDALPTVAQGKTALGLESVFDIFVKPVHSKKSPYTHPLQTPHFFIPGVPARPFYDPAEFAFTRTLEDAYPQIRKELEDVLRRQGARFQAYAGGDGELHSGWNNFYFYLFGRRIEENIALCPKTMEVLDAVPHLEKTMAQFAALNPRSGLPPHTGPFNGILRAHLPLIVPEGCELTVGGERRRWEEGKLMVFDDSFVHSVRNDSDRVRVVLFFSVYHPCFSNEEVPVIEKFGDAWQALPVTKLYESLQHRARPGNLVLEREPASAAVEAPSH